MKVKCILPCLPLMREVARLARDEGRERIRGVYGTSFRRTISPSVSFADSSLAEGAIVKHGKCKLKASWYYLASFEKRGVKQTSDAHDKKQYIDTYTKATLRGFPCKVAFFIFVCSYLPLPVTPRPCANCSIDAWSSQTSHIALSSGLLEYLLYSCFFQTPVLSFIIL